MNHPLKVHLRGRRRLLRAWRTRAVFWCGAVLVGLAAVGFAKACEWAITLHAGIAQRWPYLVPLLTPVALVLVVGLTRRFAPAARGSGIPQAIAALESDDAEHRGALLSLRVAAAKMVLTVIGLLGGASVGREGPTVHIGAALMHMLGRFVALPHAYLRRGLVLAGSAAGLAAAFNTPIAGIVFAIEELARSFEERSTGTLITAVILAGVVAVGLQGDHAYFGVANAQLPDWHAWLAVPVCGIVAGLAGGLFATLLIAAGQWLSPLLGERPLRTAFALGSGVALIGLLSGGASYGTGYEQVQALFAGDAPAQPLFPLFKALATLGSYLSGMPGGVFSPSLATGAGIGADLAPMLPQVPAAAMIVLGMVAYFTGVTQSPLTGAVIVMEMVDDHALILALLATAFIAGGSSRLVCREPIYRAMAANFLPRGRP